MHTWTAQDSASAIKEGWEIFTTDHDPGYEARQVYRGRGPDLRGRRQGLAARL